MWAYLFDVSGRRYAVPLENVVYVPYTAEEDMTADRLDEILETLPDPGQMFDEYMEEFVDPDQKRLDYLAHRFQEQQIGGADDGK